MSKTYSAGIVTAYGAAKRAGYQGTYEDFCRQQAGYAESAATVEQAKNTAVSAANTATAKAGEAATAATAAQTAKTQTEAAASQALTDISTARSGAISAVQTAGQSQTANATAQAQAAATSATTASTKASEASTSATSAGQSATNAAASATSAANAASAAQAVLDSIPEDYSDLSEDVGQLKADLDATQADLTIVEESVVEKTEVTIATAGSYYPNVLNNEYVWMLKTPIPQGAIPLLTVIGKTFLGAMTVYFFVKNANETYSVIDSVTFTTVSGTNPIQFPDGIMADNDVYIGFYSQDGGIMYHSNNENAKEYSRCPFSSVSSAQITMSGTYLIDYNMNLSYVTYHNYLDDLDERIDDLDERIDALENAKKDYIVVDAAGNGDYTTIIDAITTEPENTVIIVKPGIYEQDMTACLKKRIILIGVDRNQCIIRDSDGRYLHHPLYISCGYFENLTIEAPFIDGESQTVGASDLGAYAVHIDTDEDYGIGKQCEFHHCTIKSDFFPAVGLGMRKDAKYIFDNCELINGQIEGRGDYSDEGTLGALYFHDSNGEQGDQYISVTHCVLKSNLKYAMCPYMVYRPTQNNRVFCDFINNVLYSNVGKYTDTVWFRRNPFDPTTGIFKIGIGYGNSISTLNN